MLSEFVFVPRHAQAAEDDGWLMGYVVDATRQTTEFVILDAQRFGGEPVAVVTTPASHPAGLPRQLDAGRARRLKPSRVQAERSPGAMRRTYKQATACPCGRALAGRAIAGNEPARPSRLG